MRRATPGGIDNIGGVTRAPALVLNHPSRETTVSRQPIHITLAGRELVVDAGTTAGQAILRPDGTGGTGGISEAAAGAVIAARVNGALRDLAAPLADGDEVEGVDIASADGRAILRHSTAHVMAQAVQELFPGAKLGIGPPVENGFYYDFDVDKPFAPDDLKAIEARDELAGEPYKLELVGLKGCAADAEESVEVGGTELTMYDNLDPRSGELCWTDLCRGPHLPTTRHIPAFKLMRSGGAYWRGSEKNPQLQRIYGTAWETRQAQEDY